MRRLLLSNPGLIPTEKYALMEVMGRASIGKKLVQSSKENVQVPSVKYQMYY